MKTVIITSIALRMDRANPMGVLMLEQGSVSGLGRITHCNSFTFYTTEANGNFFGLRNVGEPVDGPPTNNVAEIQAATKAIKVAKSCGSPIASFATCEYENFTLKLLQGLISCKSILIHNS